MDKQVFVLKTAEIDVSYEVVFSLDLLTDRPKVSYCIKSYNQSHLILSAVKSAIAQSFDSMEILIWDDGSRDESIQTIISYLEMQKSNFRHNIRVFRGLKNLGNCGCWMALCEMASGELLIKADGDDFSSTKRAEITYKAWIINLKKPTLIGCGAVCIDGQNHVLGYCQPTGGGASAAYAAWSLRKWPCIDPAILRKACDDDICTPRSLFKGSFLAVPNYLVAYRLGCGATSRGGLRKRIQNSIRAQIATRKQRIMDLQFYRDKLDPSYYQKETESCKRYLTIGELELTLWSDESFNDRLHAFIKLDKSFYRFLLLFPSIIKDSFFRFSSVCSYYLKRIHYQRDNIDQILESQTI